jgi:hypothetical protein
MANNNNKYTGGKIKPFKDKITMIISGAPIEFNFTLGGDATKVVIRIVNDEGAVVRTIQTTGDKGSNKVVWDGKTDDGETATVGKFHFYTFFVFKAVNEDGENVSWKVAGKSRFNSMTYLGSLAILNTEPSIGRGRGSTHNSHHKDYTTGSLSSINTIEIDSFRQGVHALSRGKARQIMPTFSVSTIEISSGTIPIGTPRIFDDSVIYEDKTVMTPHELALHQIKADPNIDYDVIYPKDTSDAEIDPAVLEPFTIRDEVTFTVAHDAITRKIAAHFQDGNEDSFGGSNFIEQKKPKHGFPYFKSGTFKDTSIINAINPFIDASDKYGPSGKDSKGVPYGTASIRLPGFTSDKQEYIRPFDESIINSFISSSFGHLSGSIVHVLENNHSSSYNRSGSHIFDGNLNESETISATAGSEYLSAIQIGTDSRAFGDMQPYNIRGFLQLRDSLINTYPPSGFFSDQNYDKTLSASLYLPNQYRRPFIYNDDNTIIFNSSSIPSQAPFAKVSGSNYDAQPGPQHAGGQAINVGRNFQVGIGLISGSGAGNAGLQGKQNVLVATGITSSLSQSLSGSERSRYMRHGLTNTRQISYPIIGSNYYETRNLSGSIYALGTVRKGIVDKQYVYNATPQWFSTNASSSISPFNESISYFETRNERNRMTGSLNFYSGTIIGKSPLPGFSQMLRDKTKIVIDMNPIETTGIYYSTGTAFVTASLPSGSVGSSYAYFNWDLRKWEMHGVNRPIEKRSNGDFSDLSTGFDEATVMPYTGACVAFTPGGVYASDAATPELHQAVGLPFSNYGFPCASQYDATGSQILKMSDYINAPFLLEKIVWEFSASFPPTYRSDGSKPGAAPPSKCTFFILNQYKYGLPQGAPLIEFDHYSGSATVPRTVQYGVNRVKDLVTYGNIARVNTAVYDTGRTRSSYAAGESSTKFDFDDLNINATGSTTGFNGTGNYPDAITGSWRLQFPCRQSTLRKSGISELSMFDRDLNNDTGDYGTIIQMVNKLGTRNLMGFPNGRSYISPIPAAPVSGVWSHRGSEYHIPATSSLPSPYLLLPTDNLVFGFQGFFNSPFYNKSPLGYPQDNFRGEAALLTQQVNLAEGASKIIFYGSYIREGKEYHPSLNQPLTTNAIHEVIGNEPVLDQFHVEYSSQYYGSYLTRIVTGSMNVISGTGRGDIPDARQIMGRSTSGTLGTTGSFLLGVRMSTTSERYFDSMVGNPGAYHNINGKKLLDTGSSLAEFMSGSIMLGHYGTGYDEFTDSDWPYGFPYESRYASIGRNIDTKMKTKFLNDQDVRVQLTLIGGSGIYVKDGGSSQLFGVAPEFKKPSIDLLMKYYFGTGPVSGSLPDIRRLNFEGANLGTPILRGFKYGLVNAVRQTTSMVFRHDRYGQFRDMLEQRQDTRFLLERESKNDVSPPTLPRKQISVTDGVVTCKFVDRLNHDERVDPMTTNSSNLDLYATSSLPFFEHRYFNADDSLISTRNRNPIEGTVEETLGGHTVTFD